jgi:hypothetical protein
MQLLLFLVGVVLGQLSIRLPASGQLAILFCILPALGFVSGQASL